MKTGVWQILWPAPQALRGKYVYLGIVSGW